jgi:hypothetical protein
MLAGSAPSRVPDLQDPIDDKLILRNAQVPVMPRPAKGACPAHEVRRVVGIVLLRPDNVPLGRLRAEGHPSRDALATRSEGTLLEAEPVVPRKLATTLDERPHVALRGVGPHVDAGDCAGPEGNCVLPQETDIKDALAGASHGDYLPVLWKAVETEATERVRGGAPNAAAVRCAEINFAADARPNDRPAGRRVDHRPDDLRAASREHWLASEDSRQCEEARQGSEGRYVDKTAHRLGNQSGVSQRTMQMPAPTQ